MKKSDEYKFQLLTDVLTLTPEQFKRMLPDFELWFLISKMFASNEKEVVKVCGFTWIDDGCPGELSAVTVTLPDGSTIKLSNKGQK